MEYRVASDHVGRPVVAEVHDGDTFRLALVVEQESGLLYAPWLRLAGCDAPELYEDGGPEAAEWVRHTLSAAGAVGVTLGGWSFARRVAEVRVDGQSLSHALIEAGHAVPSE